MPSRRKSTICDRFVDAVFFLKKLPSKQMIEGYAARYEGVDPDRVADVLSSMRDASLLVRRLEMYFAQFDLSQLRFLAMIVIDREVERESLSVSEIADRLDVSRPVVTRTLQSLDTAGLVSTGQNKDDGRSKHVWLTPAGDTVLKNILPGYFAILNEGMTVATKRSEE